MLMLKNVNLSLFILFLSLYASSPSFSMEENDPKHPLNVIKKEAAAKNEENVRKAVQNQKEKTTKAVEKHIEDNKPRNLTTTQSNTISKLNADEIVEWWDKHMTEFHFDTQQSYSTSILNLTAQYEKDEITKEKFKEKLLKLLN